MTEFILHSIPGSPFGRAVLVALEEKRADYRLAPVKPGSHRTEPYLSLHPFGKIPALEHGDFKLYETQAIAHTADYNAGLEAVKVIDRELDRVDRVPHQGPEPSGGLQPDPARGVAVPASVPGQREAECRDQDQQVGEVERSARD